VNGDIGIELARDKQPDAILMDINLPDISGIPASRLRRIHLRSASFTSRTAKNQMLLDHQMTCMAGFTVTEGLKKVETEATFCSSSPFISRTSSARPRILARTC
jgi:CheY-like chemotaxis protein